MAFGIAGAVPFVAGSRRLLAQRPAVGSARPTREPVHDPVIDQITSEMVRIHGSAKIHGVRAEHVHGFAGQVRVLRAHVRSSDLDARVRDAVGRTIDARGRDEILDANDADDRVNAGLKRLGVDPADRPSRARLDRSRRSQTLDSLLVAGLTPPLDRLDAALARAEKSAEKFGAGAITGPRGTLVQDCWQAWGMIIDELAACAEIATLCGMPEIGGILGICGILCEICMYVSCWGG